MLHNQARARPAKEDADESPRRNNLVVGNAFAYSIVEPPATAVATPDGATSTPTSSPSTNSTPERTPSRSWASVGGGLTTTGLDITEEDAPSTAQRWKMNKRWRPPYVQSR